MSFKKRIAKLETTLNPNSFCSCRATAKDEIYTQDLTEDSTDTEPHLVGDPVPDICEQCNKPTSKNQTIIQLVDDD
ncbi:MAG TPA: hypothetical protein VK892_06380 [Pyrinomonadaceae bacterium]|nr:hypothetical protein [Pyrinomonadaceae bacterium]